MARGEATFLDTVRDFFLRAGSTADAASRYRSNMSGEDFESYCADILKQRGWHVEFTPIRGDQGVDLIATKNGKKVAIQCKHHARPIGNNAVQAVAAGKAYYDTQFAAVVAREHAFTRAAIELASKVRVELLDRKELPYLESRLGLTNSRAAKARKGRFRPFATGAIIVSILVLILYAIVPSLPGSTPVYANLISRTYATPGCVLGNNTWGPIRLDYAERLRLQLAPNCESDFQRRSNILLTRLGIRRAGQ